MITLYAFDLTKARDAKPLRNGRERPAENRIANPLEFPGDHFAAPLGFRFAQDHAGPTSLAPLRVEIRSPGEPDRAAGERRNESEQRAKRRSSRASSKWRVLMNDRPGRLRFSHSISMRTPPKSRSTPGCSRACPSQSF